MSWTWVMAATTVVNPLLNLAFIPAAEARYENGAIGAAVSLVLTEIVVVTAGLTIVGRLVFDRRTLGRVALGIAAAAAMWGVGREAQSLVGTVPSFAAAMITFAAIAAAVRLFSREEIAIARAALEGVLRRVPALRRAASAVAAARPPA
jgi:hypothetical protein